MSAPKHLWSGDWRRDSATAAEELATRRGQDRRPVEVRPPTTRPDPAPPRPSPYARALALRRSVPRRLAALRLGRMVRTRAARVIAVGALVIGGLAFALTALLESGASTNSGAPGSPRATTSQLSSLGVQIESLNFGGVVIATVAPGSPAEAAGLDPGDVITQLDNRAINTPSDVTAVLQRLHPGDQVEIQVSRGSATYTTQATLAARPSGHP